MQPFPSRDMQCNASGCARRSCILHAFTHGQLSLPKCCLCSSPVRIYYTLLQVTSSRTMVLHVRAGRSARKRHASVARTPSPPCVAARCVETCRALSDVNSGWHTLQQGCTSRLSVGMVVGSLSPLRHPRVPLACRTGSTALPQTALRWTPTLVACQRQRALPRARYAPYPLCALHASPHQPPPAST